MGNTNALKQVQIPLQKEVISYYGPDILDNFPSGFLKDDVSEETAYRYLKEGVKECRDRTFPTACHGI